MDRHIFNSTNKSVMAEYREKADYHFIEQVFTKMNTAIISLNLTNQDPVKREIFRNKDFRIGLSHAINRQEIIDIVYIGQGEPWQAAPPKETPFFHERLAKQYTEYDVALANKILDEMGLDKKDSHGMRLRFDGKPLTITLEISSGSSGVGAAWIDYGEMLKKFSGRVGGLTWNRGSGSRSCVKRRRTPTGQKRLFGAAALKRYVGTRLPLGVSLFPMPGGGRGSPNGAGAEAGITRVRGCTGLAKIGTQYPRRR